MSGSNGARRTHRLVLVALSLGLLVFLPNLAIAGNNDSSEADGSETEGQQVSVSEGDDDSSTLREGDASCGGSQVTVVTDEGTSRPEGSGACPADATAAPAAAQSTKAPASTTARTTPRPTPAAVATASSAPVESPPRITLKVQRPESETFDTQPQSSGFPLVPLTLVLTLIAVAYLVVNSRHRRSRQARQRPAVRVPEPTRAVRTLMKQYDSLAHPVSSPPPSDPPTAPIPIEQLAVVAPGATPTQSFDSRTEADVLTARYLPEQSPAGYQREI